MRRDLVSVSIAVAAVAAGSANAQSRDLNAAAESRLIIGGQTVTVGASASPMSSTASPANVLAMTPVESIEPEPTLDVKSRSVIWSQGALSVELSGKFTQGGTVIGRTEPFARVVVDDIELSADGNGLFVMGFDHKSVGTATIRIDSVNGEKIERTVKISQRQYATQAIGRKPRKPRKTWTVAARPNEDAEAPATTIANTRLQVEREAKLVGFSSKASITAFSDPWVWPLQGRITSEWGARRLFRSTGRLAHHHGVDIAAPTGTPIYAPSDGIVTLAAPNFLLEGGVVFLDHGQGLVTNYLHMSRIDVRNGDYVRRGDIIGAVGAKGQATGPHLCWRMKWNGRNLDPTLLVGPMPKAVKVAAR